MVRVQDLEASLHFYCQQLGLQESHRFDDNAGRYTLVYLNAPNSDSAIDKLLASSVNIIHFKS
jgi:lactoylglutathione lyase